MTTPVTIAGTAKGLGVFLALPKAVYRADPLHVLPSAEKVRAGIFRADFAGRQELFVVTRGGEPRARALARISPILLDEQGKPLGMIGFFEAVNDPDAAGVLFGSAVSWLRDRGVGQIVGPMDGDTWHAYRLNVGPFDEPPFLLEPHHPPYYRALWEGAGFQPLERYYSKFVTDLDAAIEATNGSARRAEASGVTLRRFDLGRFEDELRILYDLSRAIFADNFLYTDITFEDFAALYRDARPLLDADLIWFARTVQGQDVGFVFALPDNIRAVRALGGKKSPLGLLRFLLLKGRTDTVNVKTLGVLPGARGSGTSMLLMNRVYRTSRDKGYSRANLCLIREGNLSGRVDGGRGKHLREYLLYQMGGKH